MEDNPDANHIGFQLMILAALTLTNAFLPVLKWPWYLLTNQSKKVSR